MKKNIQEMILLYNFTDELRLMEIKTLLEAMKIKVITVDKETQHFKQQVSLKLADNIYNGQWYTPLTEALLAFVDKTQENVNGDVKLKLYKGNIVGAGVTSPDTLHDLQTASFDEDDDYDQYDAKGFITLYGLPIKVKAKLDQKKKK